MNGKYILGGLLAALVGCTPGEAEFTLKTSEVRKALQGEVGRIRVHETMTTVLSNANRQVTFGDGKFTNQLDVVKAMAEGVGRRDPFDFTKGAWTNDSVRIWVEEKLGALPCVKMDAQLDVALGTEAALEKCAADGKLEALCFLQVDPKTGRIGETKESGSGLDFQNARLAAFWGAAMARGELLRTLFGGKDEEDLAAVDQSLISVMLPTWFQKLSCVIVGDSDEPLYVVAEDAVVNGKPMAHFEGYVKKGETVRFELDKKKHGSDGGMRFLLKKPAA